MSQSVQVDISFADRPLDRKAWLEALQQADADDRFQDLIYSYLRLPDVRLKALALSVVQGLARPLDDLCADQAVKQGSVREATDQ